MDVLGLKVLGISRSRREALRTTLWLVPTAMVLLVTALIAFTYTIGRRSHIRRWWGLSSLSLC